MPRHDEPIIDFVVTFYCDHRGSGDTEGEQATDVYQLAHVTRPGRILYRRWVLTEGPWKEDFQDLIHLDRYRDGGRSFELARSAETIPDARHNIQCRTCTVTRPVLQTRMERILNRLREAEVGRVSLENLDLLLQWDTPKHG